MSIRVPLLMILTSIIWLSLCLLGFCTLKTLRQLDITYGEQKTELGVQKKLLGAVNYYHL